MQRLRILNIFPVIPPAMAMLALCVGTVRAQEAPAKIEAGTPFKPLIVETIQPGTSGLQEVDLAGFIGRTPIVITYFVLGESISEDAFLDVQALVESLEGKVQLFGAVRPGRAHTLDEAALRLDQLGVSVPVVVDDRLILGSMLGVKTAPSIGLIDHTGVLRVAAGKSLKHTIASGMTMGAMIEAAAKREWVPTARSLPRYYPANELVGERFPDVTLKRFQSDESVRLSDHVKEKKITGLLFWHPNCKHCKQAMPGIVVGYRSYRKWLNVVSVVDLKDAHEVRNAEDTIRAHGIDFPVLVDEERRITDLYKVVSTPTMFFVEPDGTINSVYTQGDVNYVPVFSARIRSILRVGREYEGGP